MSDDKSHAIHQGVRKDCSRECAEMGRVQTSIKYFLIFLLFTGLFDVWAIVRITAIDKEIQSVTKRVDIHRNEMDDLRKLHTVIPTKEPNHNGK